MGSLRPNDIMKLLVIFALLIGISWAQLDCSNCAYNSYQANICCATGNSYCCQFANGNHQSGQVGGSQYYPGGSSSSNQGSGLTWTGYSNNNGGSNYYPGGSNYNPGGNPGGSNYNPGGNPGGSNYNPGTPRPRYIRLNPIFNGNSKRGNCPAPSSRPDYNSNSDVVMYCNNDRHCPGQQKCCTRGGNSINKVCKQPTFGYYG